MKKILYSVLILSLSCGTFAQAPQYDRAMPLEDYNFVLGTNGIGGKYKFTKESKLLEQAKHIRGMGSNIIKISLGKKSPQSYGLKNKGAKTTLELFKSVPDYKKVFDMDFKYVMAWVHTCTGIKWKLGINNYEEKQLYDEMYEFASYILKEYNNSGKTFMIGNWEGDWLLHPNYNRNVNPPQNHVDNMTNWFQIRQKAIDDAKAKIKHENVELYHYIEVNLAWKGIEGNTCISKDILPQVDVDLVSYSSYEATKNRTFEEKKSSLIEVMDYIENQLKPKGGLPFSRRVFIGEYGYHANETEASQQNQYDETKEIMEISLMLNLPFALHWQMYNNEYKKNGDSKNMSLINESGEKRALYYLHQNYYKAMNVYLKEYKSQNNTYPNQEDFNKKALEVLRTI